MSQDAPVGDAAFDALLAEYKAAARRKRTPWKLTADQFRRLIQERCHFCHIPPAEFPGIDRETYIHGEVGRVDKASGFTLDNSIPCCQICHRGLTGSSYGEHVEWLHRVTAFQAMKRVETPDDMFGPEP